MEVGGTFSTWTPVVLSRIPCTMVLLCLTALPERCEAHPGPREKLAAVQQQLDTAREAYVELSISFYMAGHGGAVKQRPVNVTIAWGKPASYYLHEHQSGQNPACWYWLEEGRLQAFQYWEKGRPYSRAQARGVCVTNFAQLAGDRPEAAFRLAKERASDFAFAGAAAASLLELLGEARPKAMAIERRDVTWALKQRASEFTWPMMRAPFLDDRTAAFVVFEVIEGDQPLKSISVYPDLKRWPEYRESVQINRLQFAFDRKRLTFPKERELIMSVELEDLGEITSEILDSVEPVRVVSEE